MPYPAEPTHTPFGERLRERTAPLAPDDEDYGYAHAYLAEALAQPFREFQEAFDPEGDAPPLAPLLDPATCPGWALPWLAQFVGVSLPVGTSEDAAREVITNVSGFRRGTPEAMRAAAGLYLTGTKTVYFRERLATATDPPYTLEVVTLVSETPDPAKVLASLTAQKPGGIVLVYRTVAGWDYVAMTTEGGPYSALPARFVSYFAMTNNDRS